MQNGLELALLGDADREEKQQEIVIDGEIGNRTQEIQTDPFATRELFKTVLINTTSFGLRSAIVGVHYAGNGLIMSSLGANAAAASSVVTTMQNLTIGAASGFLIGTGVELGKALGRRDEAAAHAITKTSMLMSVLLGSVVAGIFLTSRYTLPLMLDSAVADVAADYFETFAIAAIPDLLIWNNGQIVFKIEKNAWMPLIATVAYRIPALGLSYYLAKNLNLGARGVGLGSGIAGWTCVALFQLWFSKEVYNAYNLYQLRINNFRKYLKTFAKSGALLSLYRTSEWGNQAGITDVVGGWSSQGLLAEQPSLLSLVVCNSFSQGGGQTSMMMAAEDCSAMRTALEDFEATGDKALLEQVKKFMSKNVTHFYISNSIGLGFNFILAGTLYFLKQYIIDLYIPAGTPASTLSLANTLFWINSISLIPDAVRIILGGQLRGWGDLLAPTLVSLFLMSGIGILAGALIGQSENENILPLFIARVVTLILAAAFNYYRFRGHVQKDERAYMLAALLSEYFEMLDSYENLKNGYLGSESSATLVQNAAVFGMGLQNVPGDGNCFFHAAALALNDGKTYADIRRIVALHVRDNIDLYQEFITEDRGSFLRDIAQGGIWADHVMILALSRALNINIVIVRSDKADPIVMRQKDPVNTIYLGYEVNKHYQLLIGTPAESLSAILEAAEIDDWNENTFLLRHENSETSWGTIGRLFYGRPAMSVNANAREVR